MIRYETDIVGAQAVLAALSKAQKSVRDATVPVMESFANQTAARAQSKVMKHPSGLWKKERSGKGYKVEQPGPYWFRVKTTGKAETISEFARQAVTGRGAVLVNTLTSLYGRPGGKHGGRILWAARDELDGPLAAALQSAVAVAEGTIERAANG